MADDVNPSGDGGRLPPTRWSAVLAARSDDLAERTRALDLLIRAYWKPVYKYIRIRWNKPADDAQDLTPFWVEHRLRERKEIVMSRVVHFEVPVDNPERAQKFYTDVFGWEITKWAGPMDYWLVKSGPDSQMGINGALTKRSPMVPSTVNTIGVESADKAIEAVAKAGGKSVMPKTPIPGVGWFAYCVDTEGNLFGIMQPDTNAK